MTKINGAELIEVDTVGAACTEYASRRNALPSFAAIRQACNSALDRMGLSRTEHGDFRQQTRREAIAHRRSVHRAVVKIKRTDLSRAKRSTSLITAH